MNWFFYENHGLRGNTFSLIDGVTFVIQVHLKHTVDKSEYLCLENSKSCQISEFLDYHLSPSRYQLLYMRWLNQLYHIGTCKGTWLFRGSVAVTYQHFNYLSYIYIYICICCIRWARPSPWEVQPRFERFHVQRRIMCIYVYIDIDIYI